MRRVVKRKNRKAEDPSKKTKEVPKKAVQMKTKNLPRKKMKCLITLKRSQNNSGRYSVNIFFR